jgi:hypothetical protein
MPGTVNGGSAGRGVNGNPKAKIDLNRDIELARAGAVGKNFLIGETTLDPHFISKRYFLTTTQPTYYLTPATLPPPVPVPEPSTWLLLLSGLAGIYTVRRLAGRAPACC